MDSFDADWLTAREPFDNAARSSRLVRRVGQTLDADAVLHALDLATGTGANVRYSVPRLHSSQEWLLVDHDPRLVAEIASTMGRWAAPRRFEIVPESGAMSLHGERLSCRLQTRCIDLVAGVDSPTSEIFDDRALVTASALLDLVSERWLRALAGRCRRARSAVLFALTY